LYLPPGEIMATRFISVTAQTVVTRAGHVIKFPAGVATHVPPESIAEVLLAAGVTADGTEQAGDDAAAQAAAKAADATARGTQAANAAIKESDSTKGEVNATPGATPGALIN
jgi:hypothetical protein